MKKLLLVTGLLLLFGFQTVHAAPPESEVITLLEDLGWTKEELTTYLKETYDLTLEEIETTEDLKLLLGTPITPENLEQLLTDYEITRPELDVLLSEFGETVEDYVFIEDLDLAISFYSDHDSEISEIEDFLALIGLTDAEVETLFTHFMELNQETLEQQMEEIVARLDPYLTMDAQEELTQAQEDELVTILQDMMSTLQLKPQFYLKDNNGVETAVTFKELINMDELYGNQLVINFYDTSGELLLDMQFSEEMLSSEFLIESGIEFAELGDIAGELIALHHNRLPDTASSLWLNMLFGLLIIAVGLIGFFYPKRSIKEQ
ncbi:processed acidic surface protein [Metabacillus crassostreae]|uniref:processed acidic surface protein n=1 Tax=Metabacillus crassostreae TaxID=929098 RepID=UPI001957418A|nr:processed acidic surface protein [Metabacillus crassostreae]MBM7606392.1 processed acidic surface protein [Metabacillus crassostreae]